MEGCLISESTCNQVNMVNMVVTVYWEMSPGCVTEKCCKALLIRWPLISCSATSVGAGKKRERKEKDKKKPLPYIWACTVFSSDQKSHQFNFMLSLKYLFTVIKNVKAHINKSGYIKLHLLSRTQQYWLVCVWFQLCQKHTLIGSLLLHRACCYIYFIQTNSCTLFKTHSHLKH